MSRRAPQGRSDSSCGGLGAGEYCSRLLGGQWGFQPGEFKRHGDERPAPCTVTVQPGESIQAAIDAAEEGAVICLAEGTWEENLVIGKSLTLRGLARRSRSSRA
jgi:hypothetical protein